MTRAVDQPLADEDVPGWWQALGLPGLHDVHVHFLGTMKLSFGHRDWDYQTGDVVEVTFAGMGEPLRNPVTRVEPDERPVAVEPA